MDNVQSQAGQAAILNLEKWPTAQKLVKRCSEFFSEVEDLTPGKELEERLNKDYGPGNPLYEDLCRLVRQGLTEGWVAETELGHGKMYRRGKIAVPSAETRFFSITTVYMESEDVFSGQYRSVFKPIVPVPQAFDSRRIRYIRELTFAIVCNYAHPYGEINCVVQVDETAELEGMNGWRGAGWTSPGPGTHHYPRVRKGALVALFFLPAGRISYKATPDMKQPLSV